MDLGQEVRRTRAALRDLTDDSGNVALTVRLPSRVIQQKAPP